MPCDTAQAGVWLSAIETKISAAPMADVACNGYFTLLFIGQVIPSTLT